MGGGGPPPERAGGSEGVRSGRARPCRSIRFGAGDLRVRDVAQVPGWEREGRAQSRGPQSVSAGGARVLSREAAGDKVWG